jgi:hypothetical protein
MLNRITQIIEEEAHAIRGSDLPEHIDIGPA